MDITLPTIPAGVLVLLGLFAPYAIAMLNGALPFITKPWQKKLVTVVIAIVLAVVVIVFYQRITGDPIGNPWLFALLSLGIVSTSYTLITKPTASAIESRFTPGASLRRDLH